MTALQGALESGAPAPGSGGEQIRMIWARTRPWPAQFLCAPNRRSACLRPLRDSLLRSHCVAGHPAPSWM
jgi:hypothetical protein